MLKFLRHPKTKKKIFGLLALVIIPAFTVWGVSVSREESKLTSSALGRIGNHKVSIQEYLKSYHAVQHEAMLRYGEQLREISKYLNLKGEAWDRLLLLDYAKKQHLNVSDKEVVTWITSQPIFMHRGSFDDKYYDLFVKNYLHLDARQFEEEIREILMIRKMSEKVRSELRIPDAELKDLFTQQNAEKDLVYGFVDLETEKANVKVDDAEVDKIYALVKDQVKDPKKTLTPEESKAKFRELIAQKEAADLVLKKLGEIKKSTQNSDLEKALTDASLPVLHAEKFKKGDALPPMAAGQDIEQVVAGLKEGEVGKPFTVPQGAAIIKVSKSWPVDEKTFEADKEKFRKSILDHKAGEAFEKLVDDLRKKLELNTEVMRKLFPEEETAPKESS